MPKFKKLKNKQLEDSEYPGFIYDQKTNKYYKNSQQARVFLNSITGALRLKTLEFTIHDHDELKQYFYSKSKRFRFGSLPQFVEEHICNLMTLKNRELLSFIEADVNSEVHTERDCTRMGDSIFYSELKGRECLVKLKELRSQQLWSANIVLSNDYIVKTTQHNSQFYLIMASEKGIRLLKVLKYPFQLELAKTFGMNLLPKTFQTNNGILYVLTKKGSLQFFSFDDPKPNPFATILTSNISLFTISPRFIYSITNQCQLKIFNKDHEQVMAYRLGIKVDHLSVMSDWSCEIWLRVENGQKGCRQNEKTCILGLNVIDGDAQLYKTNLPEMNKPNVYYLPGFIRRPILYDDSKILFIASETKTLYWINNQENIKSMKDGLITTLGVGQVKMYQPNMETLKIL